MLYIECVFGLVFNMNTGHFIPMWVKNKRERESREREKKKERER